MNINYTVITEVLFIIYGLALLFLISYGLIQIHLVYNYVSLKKTSKEGFQHFSDHPFITVQLPVYNEPLVIERLIDTVTGFNYPIDRFEVQVLDDSTDDTSTIVAFSVAAAKATGINIHHLQRSNRKGFKAGALQEGLHTAKGEFIALFDADFIPPTISS